MFGYVCTVHGSQSRVLVYCARITRLAPAVYAAKRNRFFPGWTSYIFSPPPVTGCWGNSDYYFCYCKKKTKIDLQAI